MQDTLLLKQVGYADTSVFKQSLEIDVEELCYSKKIHGLLLDPAESSEKSLLGISSILVAKYFAATLILVLGFLGFVAFVKHTFRVIGNSIPEWTIWSLSCEWGVMFLLLVFLILFFAKNETYNFRSQKRNPLLILSSLLLLTMSLLQAVVTFGHNF